MLPSLATLSRTMTGTVQRPRTLVFGLGAIGSVYAAALVRSGGCDVSVVARSNYDTVKQKGLRLKSEKHGDSDYKFDGVFRNTKEAAASGAFDFVLCANKALLDAKPSLADLLSPVITAQTSIVLLQNGVGNEAPLHEAFPSNTIISAVVWTGGKVLPSEDGIACVSQFARESLTIGVDYTASLNPADEDKKLQTICDLLAQGNSDTVQTKDIQTERWIKVIWNCAWNSLTTVTRVRTNHIFGSSPGASDLSLALMDEVCAVARAKGLKIPEGTSQRLLGECKSVGGAGLPSSMMMDNEAGRPMEVEVILGTPKREGDRLGVPVPILTTIYTIVKALDWRNANKEEAAA